jgi:hypothetical protein
MRRARAALLALAAAAGPTAGAPVLSAEEPSGAPACVVPAFVPADDAGLWTTYDGVRRGLEEASLPRVCRHPVPETTAALEEALRPARGAGTPIAFAVGRVAGERCAAAVRTLPPERRPFFVYVDVALVSDARAFPSDPDVPLPAAIVRAEVPLRRWRSVVEALIPSEGGRRPALFLPPAEPGSPSVSPDALAEALGVVLAPQAGAARALLDWDLLGRRAAPGGEAGRPVLSSDRGRFGAGACALVVPDHLRLGRVAADAGRRLIRGSEGRAAPLRVGVPTSEVWVDLDACDRFGFSPPLRFLAGADRLRRGPVADAEPPLRSDSGGEDAGRDVPR